MEATHALRLRSGIALLVVTALALPPHATAGAGAPADGTRTVTRLAGGDRVGTAISVSQHGWPDGADTVLLATADDYPDALAAAALAAALEAPILLSPPDQLTDALRDELRRLDPAEVVLLGGADALSDDLEDEVTDDGYEVDRVGGADRFETAAAIAIRVGAPAGAYTVARGDDFPDALAAAALAATPAQPPTLLVTADAIPPATAGAIDDLGFDDAARGTVVGGPAAVSDAVVNELPGRITRLHGPTRWETSTGVVADALTRWDATPRPLLVATGETFADALAAGGLAAALDAPLLLAPAAQLTDDLAAFVAAHRDRFDHALLLGGAAAVSDSTAEQLERVLNGLPRLPDPVWQPDLSAAIEYAQTRSNSVSFAAIGTDGVLVGHRPETTVPAASVLKVMFMVAYLRQPDVRDRDLTDDDRALLEPMIRQSANDPATRIADRLGPGPLNELAALAGMQDFSYTRPWGLTRTSSRDQAPFMLNLRDYLPQRHADYALQLLTEVVPVQRWGIGEVATPGWTQHFKGGWGSGTGAVDHQVVFLQHCRGTRVALAVMTTASPDHDYGTTTLREIFARLLATLPTEDC